MTETDKQQGLILAERAEATGQRGTEDEIKGEGGKRREERREERREKRREGTRRGKKRGVARKAAITSHAAD
ncbi:hypothetical protein [Cobetia sp. 1CM21F]|uniref:hypothetical protein n=1 Tax=Cobetia sp. 1CM21F TaxID=2929163 RepID=UPI0020C0D2F2|nr:hypothetical protein [Cobetia sp. 1CM21F]MCK8067229.1 hypothetical protein [Cobetia sp. 1CM21F]